MCLWICQSVCAHVHVDVQGVCRSPNISLCSILSSLALFGCRSRSLSLSLARSRSGSLSLSLAHFHSRARALALSITLALMRTLSYTYIATEVVLVELKTKSSSKTGLRLSFIVLVVPCQCNACVPCHSALIVRHERLLGILNSWLSELNKFTTGHMSALHQFAQYLYLMLQHCC